MALSTFIPLTPVPMTGLSARTTNHAAQCYVLDEPPRLDVGYVTREKRISLFLWNGSAADVTLTAISGNAAAEGITWDAEPPDLIAAGNSLRVNFTVGVAGPLEYEALISFASACALNPTLTITGTRAPQLSGDVGYFLIPHTWEDGLDETLVWKTDVLIAHDRTEQRVQLRTMPRRSWDLRLLAAGSARRNLETWISLRKMRRIFAPVWRDVTSISEGIAAGEAMVTLNTEFLDYAVGRPMAVWDSWDHFEIRTVTGIGPNYIAVDGPFDEDWPAGSSIAPCRYGVALDQRTVSRFTEDLGDFRLRFEALDESLMPAMATPELYREIPVCPLSPSWVGDEEAFDNKWVRLDNDTGLIEYDVQSLEPVLSRSASFLVIGRSRIDDFLRFLFACAGRLTPFWLPANDRGFELAQPAAAGSSVLVIGNIGYEYALADCAARGHVELITTTGTIIRRRVAAVATLPTGEEQWTLDSALPVAVSAAALNRCAWLELVRLDSDEIKLHWVAWDCIEITLPIVVLP